MRFELLRIGGIMNPILTPSLRETTQALIGNLRASEAFVRYQLAQDSLNTDSGARSLLEQLSKTQASLRQKQASGSVTQVELAALRALQEQVHGNRVIMEYAQAQQEAVTFLREINAEISQLLGIDFATFAKRSSCC
ncbi:MAG: YlbF family regulator [Chloroflexota bacterium]|nr:MAG: YlbF family regulator [Chloroflexota bacterium]